MTFRIRIFSSFGKSENCKDIYERLCESTIIKNYGIDKDINITNDDDYTHVLILNTAMPKLPSNIPKKNVIGLAFEPIVFLGLTEEFVNYAIKNIGKYFIGDKMGLPEPFTEYFSFMWYNPPLKQTPDKKKLISMMVSEKTSEDGHKYRHALIQKILQTDLPIDIYGRGCQYYYHLNDPRIKGEFTESEPYNDYQFHICIENCISNHYFSEKIINPLLVNTTPIYIGCKNINNYFPNMVISMMGNLSSDIELLCKITDNPELYKSSIDIEKVKDKIYFLRNIKNIYI
jgi:hypothetical protein